MSDQNTRQGRRQARMQESAKNKKKSSGKPKRGLFKKIFMTLVVLLAVAIIAGGVTAGVIIAGAPDLDEEKLMLAQPIQIYDQDDELVSLLDTGERRINASYDELPDSLKDAIISVEDMRFYDHFGIDLRRLAGAVRANITEGFGAEGASTITQQLVKNLFLNQEKALTRKVQEQYLAIKLEQQYSKEQILTMYLNQVYLGRAGYGVKIAAESYFDKSLEELTIADSALLAGIPRRPSYYDPIQNPDNAESRRNLIIGLMEEQGKITAEEAEEARNTPIEDQINYQETETTSPYAAYYSEILKELEENDEFTVNDIYNSGLKVYTSLDQSAQKHVENVLESDEYITNYPDNPDFQAGVTLIDTKTGQIKAIGSGRQQSDNRNDFNYATDITRQPGSTIKPILDYGPAIEYLQWSTAHILVDEPHTYSDGKEFGNYGGTYRGAMSMRQALSSSQNVPAVKALQEVGLDRAEPFAKQLLTLNNDDSFTEAYALGGFNTGVSTKDMAGAYAAFGNGGTFTEPHTIRKIVFADDREINLEPESVKAMEDYTAYMITDMLKTVVSSGTGQIANVPGVPVAGKTGTTNFTKDQRDKNNIPSSGSPDSWFAGYSTNYTAAVWTGYDGVKEGNYINRDRNENQIAQNIFKAVMQDVSTGIENPDFVKPDSVIERRVERGTEKLPSSGTPQSEIVTELFVRGAEPTQESETYEEEEEEEIEEIPSPTGLQASYEEAADQIIATWNYPDSDVDVTFDVQVTADGGSGQSIEVGSNQQAIFSAVEPGTTYQISVTAVSTEDSSLRSSPATTSVTVAGTEEDEEEEEEPVEEEPPEEEDQPEDTPDENNEGNPDENNGDNGEDAPENTPGDNEDGSGGNGNGNGNGNDNGNGNGNDNGNGNNGGGDSGNGNGNQDGGGNDDTGGGEDETPSEPEPDTPSDDETDE
ncbi:PBP1A family penicillin-binding protein [Alkalicoccobacillus gibsonii]|uniref:PBP1A family penicillin-binding protein n=1 Tax=Alkalicoccobacillus gibsonii TaxID=79881 RepID=UPI003F7C9DB5